MTRGVIAELRSEVDKRMQHQLENAREWRDVCLKYFGSFVE